MAAYEGHTDSALLESLRGRLIYPEHEAALFDEAARCISGECYRAAVAMAWIAAAEGIKYRFAQIALKDTATAELVKDLKRREEQGQTLDTILVDKAAVHGMITAHEKKQLHQVRAERNDCAHPSGATPSATQAMYALDVAVRVILSRPALLPKSYAENLLTRVSNDPTFFAHDPDGLRTHTSKRLALFTDDATLHLAERVLAVAAEAARDPDRRRLLPNITAVGATVFIRYPELLTQVGVVDLLTKRHPGAVLTCLDQALFTTLDEDLANQALSSVLERPFGAPSDWRPDVLALSSVGIVLDGALRTDYHDAVDRYRATITGIPLKEVPADSVAPVLLADRISIDLSSHDWPRQNEASLHLSELGPAWCAVLGPVTQTKLGDSLATAVTDDAFKAVWFVNEQVRREPAAWPRSFRQAIERTAIAESQSPEPNSSSV